MSEPKPEKAPTIAKSLDPREQRRAEKKSLKERLRGVRRLWDSGTKGPYVREDTRSRQLAAEASHKRARAAAEEKRPDVSELPDEETLARRERNRRKREQRSRRAKR